MTLARLFRAGELTPVKIATRRTHRHPGASDEIQHPRRHDRDYAGCDLDVNDLTPDAPLDTLAPSLPGHY
jgi:hypothetical protein